MGCNAENDYHTLDESNARWFTPTRKCEAPEITSKKLQITNSDVYCVGKELNVMIEEFKKPIARDIIAVVTSLLIAMDTKRMMLMQAEQFAWNKVPRSTRRQQLFVSER